MPLLPSEEPAVSPHLTAGLLLAAMPHLHRLDLPHPTAAAIIDALGVSRSRAYELRSAVEAALPMILRRVGRPTAPPVPPAIDLSPVLRACRDFAYDHPGAVGGTGVRRRYSDGFRCFVLDLAAIHREVSLDVFAEAAGVPVATLRDWLGGGIATTTTPETLAAVLPPDPTQPQVETLLDLWSHWQGSFVAFCDTPTRTGASHFAEP